MKKFIFFTNIPTPYRTSFYNELYARGLDFQVYYMRETEADRNWQVDRASLRHPHSIDRGYYRMVGRYHLHLNPALVWKLLRSGGAEIIVCGSWNDIDVLALALFRRLGLLKSRLHFWSEANYLTIGASHDNLVKKLLRKFVYLASPGFQIASGRMTELTFEKWGIPGKQFIPLPNTIEEEKFQVGPAQLARRLENEAPVFLMPVRLVENIKGILNFFRAIGPVNVRRARFLIAGDGPDRESIARFIEENGYQDHVTLLGFCDSQRMVALYQEANVFLLPSFSDPCPLTLVEALCMKLPVLVSERCGNHFEAVLPGENGYTFNPLEPDSVRAAFEALLARREQWPRLGERSGELYRSCFMREAVLDRFLGALDEYCREPSALQSAPEAAPLPSSQGVKP